MVLVNLFLAFFRVGLLAIGGAYSFLPLIEKEVVERYHWLTKEEFLDISGIVQIFPGAISIKYATYTGYKIAGFLGAIIANLGNILAPVILIAFASVFYLRYKQVPRIKFAFEAIRIAIFAMIVAVAFQTIDVNNIFNIKNLLIIILAFGLFIYSKFHPAIIILLAGIIGALWRR